MIYFMTPDDKEPSGGILQIYAMVDGLNALGMPAVVFHGASADRCDWFENSTNAIFSDKLTLVPGDLLIMPEWGGAASAELPGVARVVVLNQNHFNTFRNAGFSDTMDGAYPGWRNVRAIISTSNTIARFLSASLRGPIPIHVVRCVVDSEMFAPTTKSRLVAFMPRKRRNDAESLVQLLRRRKGLEGWEFRSLNDVSHREVADCLAEAAIFLSLSDREGFGLPAAEAMAAASYVIGFVGDGGREFMFPDLCSPIAEPDLYAFAMETERIAMAWDRCDPLIAETTTRARLHVASTYSRSQMIGDLERTFARLCDPTSEATQTTRTVVRHYSHRRLMFRLLKRMRPLVPNPLLHVVRRTKQ